MMWDYGSDGLWDAATGDGIQLEALPLADGTRTALREWVRRIDDVNYALMESDNFEEENPELIELERVGRRLWRDIRRELSPQHEIGYAVAANEEDAPMQVLWAPDAEPQPLPWGDH